MTQWMLKIGALALFLSLSALAMAQDADAPSESVYDFEGDTVEGALLRPEGDLMSGVRHGKDSSLINIRADFIPEMVRSVHEL